MDVVDEILAVVAIVAAAVETAAAVVAVVPFEQLHCLEKRELVARIARLGGLALFEEVDTASPI